MSAAPVSPRAAFRHPGFAAYWASRFLTFFAVQAVAVAIGWQVYELSNDPLDLGLVGLFQFLPSVALVLVTGSAADRFSRRRILVLCLAAEIACAGLILAATSLGLTQVWPIFVIALAIGVARAFYGPASQSLTPNLVPPEHLGNAVTWNASARQIAIITGSISGGLLYGLAPEAAYAAAIAVFLAAAVLAGRIPRTAQRITREPVSWTTLLAGFRYIWTEKILLGATSLDLFAVLLGGVTALLPAYARDILQVGPWGLGLLRAGSGFGSVAMAAWLVLRPPNSRAGATMLIAVACFGAASVVFGLSTALWLSVPALALMGAGDVVSVYVRQTLIQLATPDAMRGRVNAVSSVFVGASNELGEFRAGAFAALIGVVPAVVVGGFGAMLVAALWAAWFPELRRVQRLTGVSPRLGAASPAEAPT